MHKGVAIVIMVLLVLSAGCRIRFTMTGVTVPPEAKTISVAYFPNRAPIVYPALSQDFTETLKDKLIAQTPLQMVSDGGDLSFEGEIMGYETKPIAVSQNNQQDQASLNRLSVTVNVRFVSQYEPAKNFEARFTAYEDYSSDQGLDAVEGELVPLIVEKIIEDVFNRALVNW